MRPLLFGLLAVFFLSSHSPLAAQQIDPELFEPLKPRNIGPAGMSGRVTAIDAVVADPNIIYIGTAAGGVWKSTNGGLSFTPVFDDQRVSSIGAVAINQQNPQEIWAGTGEGNPRNSVSSGYGIYRSLDSGHSWQFMGLGETRNIHRVIIHPQDPKTVWVGAIGSPWGEHEERGVYKTTDGGQTWNKVLYVNEKTGLADLVLDPNNPNKLVAAMWEHRRWPWYFNSGGPGSGLYISYDGGESWEERTADEGLPKGELGRIGLAIAPSNSDVIYALVEAKKNGLYKSTDGGFSWKLVADEGIGGRPFYYADIFVDPQNENRLFNIHTTADVSQDGGKTFERFIPTSLIHVDNHAFWIHPDNPKLIMNGNDGGFCLSRDGGESWDFTENLPLGQFYHIRVDDAVPYNVYGGMQDNGSWRGPSQVWRRKGIRNLYWNRIGSGDGFDAMPDPQNDRFGYSLSQGGNLNRFDLETGLRTSLKPYLETEEPLRYHWNAALAINPHDEKTIYLGSQYVLKSEDQGHSWTAISPDLTTDNPEKQQQVTTGGLSLDNSGAENHTTIISIDPSPLDEGLIWVGTDDGNIQLTRDGGASWTNLSPRIKGMPEGSWVAQVNASLHDPAEAFAVVNNYRQNDWQPYLYHTDDYGRSWTSLVDTEVIKGHTLALAQDPIEENLLFLGAEDGFYVSIDKGENWTKWNSFPSIPARDLVVHPREHDLVIGTFGRAAWILDDIRPLRELAKEGYQEIVAQDLYLFPVPDAYLSFFGEPNGYRSTGNGLFFGENREQGALITFYLKELDADKKATVQVYDSAGELIRTFKEEVEAGSNRISWDLRQKGVESPSLKRPKADASEPRGHSVLPGQYTVEVSYGDQAMEQSVVVIADPAYQVTKEQMMAKAELIEEHEADVARLTAKMHALGDARETANLLKGQLSKKDAHAEMLEKTNAAIKKIDAIVEKIDGPEDVQGLYNDPGLLSAKRSAARRSLQDVIYPVTETNKKLVATFAEAMQPIIQEIDDFLDKDWMAYQAALKAAGFSLFSKE
ncbi:MAG TPA: hypothetical protein VJ953_22520 [Saprospiraceae bacterium]|nr:hypothetical protein [Saprospiraceae bacterium]